MFRITIIFIIIFLIAFFATISSAKTIEVNKVSKEAKALDIAVPLIAKWEGLRLNAYLDIVNVPTICYGSTRGIKLGMTKTKEQCNNLLREEVAEYRHGWLEYITQETYESRLPPARQAAYTSLAYNVGTRGAGRSTATRRLNAGDIAGGCKAIGRWNRAGKRVVRGLVNRRADEVKLCLI